MRTRQSARSSSSPSPVCTTAIQAPAPAHTIAIRHFSDKPTAAIPGNAAIMDFEGPPPDFGLISQACTTLADQFQRADNMPVVDNGARMMQMMQNIVTKLDRLQGTVEGIQRDVNGLKEDMVAVKEDMAAVKDGQARLEGRMGRLEGRMDLLETRLGRLEVRMDVQDRELLARDRNLLISRQNGAASDNELVPLFSLVTGSAIENFPTTTSKAEYDRLPLREVDRVLAELKLDFGGSGPDRRKRLLRACGISWRPL